MIKKRTSKRSQTLAAALNLYGFIESPQVIVENSLADKYYTFFNFIDGTHLNIISVVISKSKSKYRIRSNRAKLRAKFKPITKTSLSEIIQYLEITDLSYAISNSKEPEDY